MLQHENKEITQRIFYVIQSTPTPRGHTQKMKHISINQIITSSNCLFQRKTLFLLLPQHICVDAANCSASSPRLTRLQCS